MKTIKKNNDTFFMDENSTSDFFKDIECYEDIIDKKEDIYDKNYDCYDWEYDEDYSYKNEADDFHHNNLKESIIFKKNQKYINDIYKKSLDNIDKKTKKDIETINDLRNRSINNIDKYSSKKELRQKNISKINSDFKNNFGKIDDFKIDKYSYSNKKHLKNSDYGYSKKFETPDLDKALLNLKASVEKLKKSAHKSLTYNPSEEKLQTNLSIFKEEYGEIVKYLKTVNYKKSSILYKKFKISSDTIDELYTRFLCELRMSLRHDTCLNSISKKEDFIIDYSIMYFNITELKIPLNIYYKIKKITSDFKFITI